MAGKRFVLLVICIAALKAGPLSEGCPAGPANEIFSVRQTGDRSLDEWHVLLKQLHRGAEITPELVSELVQLVQADGIPEATRQQTALALGRLGTAGRPAIPVLVAMYGKSTELNRRLWLLKSFARFGSTAPELAPVVIETLNRRDVNPLERASCLDVLSRIGAAHERSIPAMIQLLPEQIPQRSHFSAAERERERVLVIESLAFIGPAAGSSVPELISATRETSEAIRRAAAGAIGRMGAQAELAFSPLLDLVLDDASEAVRDVAADSLAACGDRVPKAIEYLLGEEDPQIRLRAVRLGGQLEESRGGTVEPLLVKALSDGAETVRLAACESLGKQNRERDRVLQCLLQLLQSPQRQIRIGSVRLLDEMGEAVWQIAPQLRELSMNPDGAVRQSAQKALQNLSSRNKPR